MGGSVRRAADVGTRYCPKERTLHRSSMSVCHSRRWLSGPEGAALSGAVTGAPKVRDGVHRRPLSRDLTYYCSESQKSQSCSAANAEVVTGMGSCNDWY